MSKVADRVKETSTTTGTGSFTLAGAAAGFRAFNDVFSSGDLVFYAIVMGTEWEVGSGTFTATATLARTTILASSNSGSAVNFSAGTKDVFCTLPAAAMPTTITIACSDETTAITSGTGKVTFRMPRAATVLSVRASLTTGQSSGSIFTVDINEAGSSILSTKLTIDNTEKTSVTANTPPIISDAVIADDAEMTIDVDQVGDGTAKGLKVQITYI